MMDNFKIPISNKGKHSSKLSVFFTQTLFTGKTRFILPVLVSIAFAVLISLSGLTAAALILIVIIGAPLVVGMIAYPRFGTVILLISAYFIMWIAGMGVDFPLGTVMDGLQALLLIGLLIQLKRNPNWAIFKTPIGYMVLIWIFYNLLQFFNPTSGAITPWIYTIRSVAAVMLMYFVFVNNINTIQFIRFILKLWIAVSVFAALYALKQEYVGFFAFEERGHSDPRVRALLYIAGHWRKSSIFTDPVAFAYNMVISSLLCIALLFGQLSIRKKILLGAFVILFMSAMLTSGTRGAYVLIPASMILLFIVNLNKKVFIFTLIAGTLLAGVVFMPFSSPSIRRFQSAFRPSQDASFNVRQMTQKRIQPFIRSHPFGAGLGILSNTGKRLVPYNLLRGFAPDSGYVRVAGELGWVGLLLFCTLFFIILKNGIDNFYRIRNPELKTYCLAMVLITFALAVGSYPQEAIVQFPSSIYFCLVMALITVTARLDKQSR